MASKHERKKAPERRKVQSELVGAFLAEMEDVEARTSLSMSDLIRQGLARVKRELEEKGYLVVLPVPKDGEKQSATGSV